LAFSVWTLQISSCTTNDAGECVSFILLYDMEYFLFVNKKIHLLKLPT